MQGGIGVLHACFVGCVWGLSRPHLPGFELVMSVYLPLGKESQSLVLLM